MKISTKGQYAVRLMAEIAKSEDLVSTSQISKTQEISQKYLEQIISLLVKNNLLESTRGHMGGYKLTKSAKEISIKEILDCTGDACELTPCMHGNCDRKNKCDAMGVWYSLSSLVNDYLEKISLEDLINKNY